MTEIVSLFLDEYLFGCDHLILLAHQFQNNPMKRKSAMKVCRCMPNHSTKQLLINELRILRSIRQASTSCSVYMVLSLTWILQIVVRARKSFECIHFEENQLTGYIPSLPESLCVYFREYQLTVRIPTSLPESLFQILVHNHRSIQCVFLSC